MKLKEIKSANEYLGKEVVKETYLKHASKNIKGYFGIPLKKNEPWTPSRKTQ